MKYSCKKPWAGKKRSSHKSTAWLTKYKPRASVIYRPDVGLGRSVATRLKTVAYVQTANIANGVLYNLLPGSAFNPLGDAANIQPASFDQWKTLFARYLVTGATVTITVLGASAATTQSVIETAAYPSTVVARTVIAGLTFQEVASQPYAQSRLASYGAPPAIMHFKLSAQQVIGRRTPVNAEDNGALISASPTTGENMVMPVFFSAGGGTSVFTVKFDIIQDVVFDQRIQVYDA